MSMNSMAEKYSLKQRVWPSTYACVICGSKAIGINFGAPTCAPCKAFFRRNARRHEILRLPCQIIECERTQIDLNEQNNHLNSCQQIRRCTSCRLRRCFDIGMREELVRSDEEKQRYRLLIESNRQRRNGLLDSKDHFPSIPHIITSSSHILEEKDWTFLSNIVSAYENYCLNIFRDNREQIFVNYEQFHRSSVEKINHHMTIRLNNITSLLKFFISIPLIQSLPYHERYYLSRHNVRSLIFFNLLELEQTCFSESWQTNVDDEAAEHVYGRELFLERTRVKKRAESILITDPVLTRLSLLILFFSSPLMCFYDERLFEQMSKFQLNETKIQDELCRLLWNYLLHRHGLIDAVRIFSNTIRIYLQLQRISQTINHRLRERTELKLMSETFDQAIFIQHQLFERKEFN